MSAGLSTPFQIFGLTETNVSEFIQNPTPPHRHDYEEIILLTSGNPCHYIDFRREQLQGPVAVYVAMGKIHQFLPDANTRGWAIRYTHEFIPATKFNFYAAFLESINYPVNEPKLLNQLTSLCVMMEEEYHKVVVNYVFIRHILEALLSKLESQPNQPEKGSGDAIVMNNFLKILEANFRRAEGVEFYSDKLNMTARNLNHISKNIFNKSISELIESRKLTEAKQLLIHTTKSVSEIGFEIGYSEKSYFTRVFHKKTGFTPTEFRAKMQELLV
jgi:AraC family transcriptional regulator, transcriptional activator of pobA